MYDEKKIDELARMMRDFIQTDSVDMTMEKCFSEFISQYNMAQAFEKEGEERKIMKAFLTALKREFYEPEVKNRKWKEGQENYQIK